MQKMDKLFTEQLSANNLRLTVNRMSILTVLSNSDRPMTIQEMIASDSIKSYFTSVYRSVDSMVKVGIIREVPRGFKIYYELGEKFRPHHHHLTCEVCHKSIPIDDHGIEEIMIGLAIDSGFKATHHQFEMFGICQDCQK